MDVRQQPSSARRARAGTFTALIERGTVDLSNPAECVGCGCTDQRACMEGCSWLGVNRRSGRGVCSSCPDQLEQWKAAQK